MSDSYAAVVVTLENDINTEYADEVLTALRKE